MSIFWTTRTVLLNMSSAVCFSTQCPKLSHTGVFIWGLLSVMFTLRFCRRWCPGSIHGGDSGLSGENVTYTDLKFSGVCGFDDGVSWSAACEDCVLIRCLFVGLLCWRDLWWWNLWLVGKALHAAIAISDRKSLSAMFIFYNRKKRKSWEKMWMAAISKPQTHWNKNKIISTKQYPLWTSNY